MVISMEWKPNKISKAEMERRQAEYTKKAFDMAKRSKYSTEKIMPEEIKPEKKEPKPNAGMSIQIITEKTQPVRESTPVKESVPVRETPPVRESVPVRETPPVRESVPVRETPPAEAIMPVKKPVPVRETVPVQEIVIRHEKVIEADIDVNVEIGVGGILTEQEIEQIQPRQEIPEKIMSYSNNDTETLFEECVCEKPSGETKPDADSDILKVKRKAQSSTPPNFTDYINRHNQRFEEQPSCKIHGSRREPNCPHCFNSKKNWI